MTRLIVLALIMSLGACSGEVSGTGGTSERSSEAGAVGSAFARSLIAGQYDEAAKMLAPELATTFDARALQVRYEKMISYGDGPAENVEVMATMSRWPDKRPDDIGWAYVHIGGPGYNEAVTVVVTRDHKIRELEWGRP